LAPIHNIVGKAVALGPLRRDLLPLYLEWFNDFAALRNLDDAPRPRTLEAREQWYEQRTTDERAAWFTIYATDGWQPLGTTAWGAIDYRNRTAEYFVYIGAHGNRGKGYGTEATRLMLDYAFTALGLHSVMLTVAGWNVAGLRAYEKAGFRVFGRRHACSLMAGRRWDTIYMECPSTAFESPVLAHIFVPDAPHS
jgi:diamine N-acetyltransferase